MSSTDERLWSVAELHDKWGISKTEIYAHCKPGAADYWDHQRICGQIKFTAAQRDAILAATRAAPAGPELPVAPVVDMRLVQRGLARKSAAEARVQARTA